MRTKLILLYILWLVLLPLVALAGDEFEVGPSGIFPSVSMNAQGEVLVARFSESGVTGRVLAPDDTPRGPELQISEPTSDYIESLSGSIDPRGFSVVWEQSKRFSSISRIRRYDAAGEPVADRMNIGGLPAVETDPRGKSVVVSLEGGKILGRRFNATGVPAGPPIVLADPRAVYAPILVTVDARGNFVVVWKNEERELLGRRFDNGGQPRGPVFRIARSVGDYFDIAGNGQGSFVALWTTTPGGLWARSFSPSGEASSPVLVAPRVAEREILRISVAIDAAGRFLATWDGLANVFGRFFEASGTPLDRPFRVGRRPAGERDFAPDAAGGAAGQFFVVWSRGPENGPYRMMGRRLTWPARP